MFFQHCRDAEVPLHGRLHQFIGCLRRPHDVSRCHVQSSCQIWYWQYPEVSLKLATVRECTADDSFGCTEPPSMTNCFSNCLVFVVTVGDAAGRFSWSGSRCPSVTIRALGDFFSSSSRTILQNPSYPRYALSWRTSSCGSIFPARLSPHRYLNHFCWIEKLSLPRTSDVQRPPIRPAEVVDVRVLHPLDVVATGLDHKFGLFRGKCLVFWCAESALQVCSSPCVL